MNNNWFWHNRVMTWVEQKLIVVSNWLWKKRHPPYQNPNKPSVKRTTRKKNNWNVKP